MCILLKIQEIDQNLTTYKCRSYTLPADVTWHFINTIAFLGIRALVRVRVCGVLPIIGPKV
jgi:hypothetical protein